MGPVPWNEREAPPEAPPAGRSPEVLVIGGGVSGCACAAALAERGISVTVISSALDGMGQPGFGPDVIAGAGGWERVRETLAALPAVMREVWLNASMAPAVGDGFFVIDRRVLSIETKRALESLPGLRLRQGLVVGVRLVPFNGSEERSHVVVDTAFGEEIAGEVGVVAVGLGLGGHVFAGEDVLPGGRYGETRSDGLRASLEDLGCEFAQASVAVGPRLARARVGACLGSDREGSPEGVVGARANELMVGTVSLRDALAGRYGLSVWEPERSSEGGSASWWDDGWPKAPHLSPGLRLEHMVVVRDRGGGYLPCLSPDGLATGEVHATFDCGGLGGERGSSVPLTDDEDRSTRVIASRLEHRVSGLELRTVSDDLSVQTGKVGPGFLWVAGHAGGASDYLGSLASGTRVAEHIARSLRNGAPER